MKDKPSEQLQRQYARVEVELVESSYADGREHPYLFHCPKCGSLWSVSENPRAWGNYHCPNGCNAHTRLHRPT